MTKKQSSPFNKIVLKIVSTRPGSWFFAHTLHHFDRISLKISGGRWTLSGILAGLPIYTLTSTGAKSGMPRSVPLVGITDPGCPEMIAFVASNWGQDHHPAWYFNLKKNPQAKISTGDVEQTYIAHEAAGEEYDLFWQDAVDAYLGYSLYKQRARDRRIPIIVCVPEQAA